MMSFKLPLFFSYVLLVLAGPAFAQNASDLDDGDLLSRVKKEIDALVLAGDKARTDREAFEGIDASIEEARDTATAPLPADPGEIAGLEGLDEPSLVNQVELRKAYLAAYRKRKEQLERIPSLTDTRRKMIKQAVEALPDTEQRAGDLRPLLAELARRISAGGISQDDAVFGDHDVEFWRAEVVRQQVEFAVWLEAYSAEKQLPESRPAPEAVETVWNLETERRLQHSLDVATILLEAARHEASEREALEQPDHAALPAAMALVHGEWGWERDEYQRILDRVGAKRKELADLETNRRELVSPSKESISGGEGHAELESARRNAAFSDKLVEFLDARLELRRQASDVAKVLAEGLAAVKPVFERARRQTIKLKVTLDMVERRQRDGELATVEVPEDVSLSSLATYMWNMADLEATRRREVEELGQRQDKALIDAAGEELDKEKENNQRLHDVLKEELSYAEVLEEMATESETNLIALMQPDGTINETIDKMNAEVQDAQRELDLAEQSVRDVRDDLGWLENPYVRKGYRIAPNRLAAIKGELQVLTGGRLPEDRSSNPLVPKTTGDPAAPISADADESLEEDPSLLDQAESAKKALTTQQGFATLHWRYFQDLDQKIKEYTEALDATEEAFELTDQKRSALVNAEKRKYACALELRRRLHGGRIDRSQVSFDLSQSRTRESITKVQSDRGERARAYKKRRKSHQDKRDRLQAIAGLGEWAKIRADFADKKATRISQAVQLLDAASMLFEDLAPVERKQLEYDAKNQVEADDIGWESLLGSEVSAKKRELFEESLDTFYLTIARTDEQLRDYARASEAYQDLIELCETELDRIEDAPEKLSVGLQLRIDSYQTARYLAAVAASPSAQLTIGDAFKQEFASPLPIPEETHDWDKDFWARRLHEAEARLEGHQSWTEEIDILRSKRGLEADVAKYEQHRAKIENKITELAGLRENHDRSLAVIRSDYSKEIRGAALWTLGSLVLIPLLAWFLVRLVNRFARRIEERAVYGMARDRAAYHERMKTLSSVTRNRVSNGIWVIAGLYLLYELGMPAWIIVGSAVGLGLAVALTYHERMKTLPSVTRKAVEPNFAEPMPSTETLTLGSSPASIPDRVGCYHLERVIAVGGMGTVYLAQDMRHDRKVAVKVLRPELAAVLGAQRFLNEIKVTANLQHPHILPLYDSGEAEGFLFYVMPFVEGESLRDRMTRERQLPINEAVKITREVADGLAYAHDAGVVHRDIKPGNILLSGGHAVIADFGIARAVDTAGSDRFTQTGFAVGTPAYMSPEQASAVEKLDGRSDIYSLGAVLYEMLGGDPPFMASTPQAILARKAVEPVPSLRVVRETVPETLELIVAKSLAKAPADRFATAAQFAKALRDAQASGMASSSQTLGLATIIRKPQDLTRP